MKEKELKMQVILHKNNEGNNAITSVANGYNIKKIQSQLDGVLVDSLDNINIEYINAYDIEDNSINLNLNKVKDLKVQKIREERDNAFIEFDKRFDIAFKDDEDLTELKQERIKLKNAPEVALSTIKDYDSFDDILNLTLKDLI
tara:strand:- start:4399 stop:4830 length:432 start_codon:yes stop_codon:yes gene_type:complete